MVARLTPGQKAACSNHVGISLFFPGSKIDKCICFLICIAVRVSKGIRLEKICTVCVLCSCNRTGCFSAIIRELKQTTTTTATRTSLNKRFNEQNNSCARVLQIFIHFFAVLCKTTT